MTSIEKAIGQRRPFRNEHHEAIVNLIYTSHWCQDKIKSLLKPYGVTMQQYNVLRILAGAGDPISTSEIRDRLLDKMSDTSRMVERLHKKGWVSRKTCPSDKRLVDVSLSDEGRRVLRQLENIEKPLDQIFDTLEPEEAKKLSELLNKLRD